MFRFLFRHVYRPVPRGLVRLKVEVLEGRIAPAIFNVNSLADVFSPGSGVVTLRSAIQSANTTPGPNTINITVPGIYKIALVGTQGRTSEHDNVAGEFAYTATSDLNIVNTSGGSVIVDGGGLNRVFDINPELSTTPFTVTFQNFTITDGMAGGAQASFDSGGGGVRAQGVASVVLTNMDLENNFATVDGGGISMEDAPASAPWTLTINNSSISANHAGDSGGGVETDGAGQVFVNAGSVIRGNTADNQGGGLWLDAIADGVAAVIVLNGGAGYTTAPTVTFSAPQNPGGVTAVGTATITAGTVTSVTITNPGSGYTAAPTVTFSPPSAAGTTATGITQLGYNNSASLIMTGTTVADNHTVGMLGGNTAFVGGGIGNAGSGSVTIIDSTIENNSSVSGGGFGDAGTIGALSVVNSYFLSNVASWSGGGIQDGGPTVTISGTLFQSNFCGGGLGGGGLYFNGTTVTMSDCVFRQNVADDGGGMEDSAATTTLTFCTFDSNHALSNNGAGIDVSAGASPSLQINHCLFLGNIANDGFVSYGGAIQQSRGTLVIQDSQFTGNVTGGNGGAVQFAGTYITILGSTFNLNTAGVEGGAVSAMAIGAFSGSNVSEFANDTFVGNVGGDGGGLVVEQDLVLLNDTISNNAAATGGSGGGILAFRNIAHQLNIQNTVIALNSAASGPDVICPSFNPVTDLGGNLVTNTSGSVGFAAGTLSGNPLLGRLENNGGTSAGAYSDVQIVQTEALLPGSPAIGIGLLNGSPPTDQRGFPRPAGGRTKPSGGAYEPQYNASATPNQIYVENLYEVLLNRTAVGDPGSAGWVTALNGGAAAAAVIATMETSGEYLGDRVQLLYLRYLHRSAGGSEQAAYVHLLQQGVTFQQMVQGMVGSGEYFQLHGGTSEGFVQGLYEDILDRGAASTEVQAWLAMLGSISRAQAVGGFLGSGEYLADFVQDNYINLLGRTADPAGLSAFKNLLQAGSTYQILVAGLLGSAEAFSART